MSMLSKNKVFGGLLGLVVLFGGGAFADSGAWDGVGAPVKEKFKSFSSAKKALYKKVYRNLEKKTFYVGCPYNKKKVNLKACGMEHAFKKSKRAKRIEAEHVIPASWMYKKDGVLRDCAKEAKAAKKSARKYCQEVSAEYRMAHNDLVNLRPANGRINELRSNKPFSDRSRGNKKRTFTGERKVLIDTRVIVPDASIRGDIARIGMYMSHRYGVTYSKRLKSLFVQWNKDDPVGKEECRVNRAIERVQGWGNAFVSAYCGK